MGFLCVKGGVGAEVVEGIVAKVLTFLRWAGYNAGVVFVEEYHGCLVERWFLGAAGVFGRLGVVCDCVVKAVWYGGSALVRFEQSGGDEYAALGAQKRWRC